MGLKCTVRYQIILLSYILDNEKNKQTVFGRNIQLPKQDRYICFDE